MFGHLNLLYPCNSDVDPISNYHKLAFVFVVGVSMYALTKLAESDQHHFDNRATRVFAGLLLLLTRMLHTRNDDLEIKDAKNKLITAGPHRTGWEALVVASKIKGTPPRFLATDAFNFVPGVSQFMTTFKTIPVKYTREKNETGRPANADAVTLASQALNEDGCVVLFPQGNFSRIDEAPPIVYPGAAKIALANKIPIQVMRLDGFWSMQNPFIPMYIRNSVYYRVFFSALHMNNVRATLCPEIDFHLQPENATLSDNEKIEEICAQLYAYYRHTEELSTDQIHAIKTEISDKQHILIWNKAKQANTEKVLAEANKKNKKE